jgi:hypothetical protein
VLVGGKLQPSITLFMPIIGATKAPSKFPNVRHFGDSYELLNSVSMIG